MEHDKTNTGNSTIRNNNPSDTLTLTGDDRNGNQIPSTISFVIIFAFLIIISYFANKNDLPVFTNWNNIGALGLVELGVGILLCFFIPGYAIVLIISKKYKMDTILAVLLAYLLSILITGLTAYIAALSFDTTISEHKDLFIVLYIIILCSFLICFRQYVSSHRYLQFKHYFCYHFISSKIIGLWKNTRMESSRLLVFASLFIFIIISTYVLYGGITIGDQWYHQGRALLFMSGSFREAAISHADEFYPPFQSALLAALTTLSGIPLVNSYASIAFLNSIPIFAFYYFFKKWVPTTLHKAGLLACTLFTLSAGFGWIYLFSTDLSQNIISQQSILETLVSMGRLDIVGTSNFVIPTGPDFSTGLIYIALPAGFVLLGLVRTNLPSRLVINISLLVTITVLGVITHYEFYIFVIIASILPIIFKMKQRNYVYFALLLSLSIVYLMDISTPGNFFSSLKILGYPLLVLTVILVLITWTIYVVANYLHKILESRLSLFDNVVKLLCRNRSLNYMTVTAIIFLITYLYLVSFMVLSELPLDTIDAHASEGTVPWYLYPMKLGVVGILGMAFLLSYLYKKFEKEVYVFGIIIVVAVITGPYYNEYRFSKYVMVGMIGFASLMLHKILLYRFKINEFRNIAIIGIIVVGSGLSMFMFIGFNSLILQTQDFIDTLPRRHFPSMSELQLYELLYNKFNIDSNEYNIVSFPNEYARWKDGVMSKIPSFAGLPYDKLRQSPLTLNASTPDALFHHIASSNTRYIIIPKDSIRAESVITEPTRFVLEYFKRVYEDDDYILLEVPALAPPNYSSGAQVALIFNQHNDLVSDEVSDIRLLQFDNETFDFDASDNKSVTVQKYNMSQELNLLGAKMDKGITIWSKEIPIEKKVNYIEARFQIVSENENKSNDVRIGWHETNERFYYAKLSNAGLELYENLKDNQYKKILLKNAEINKENQMWYTLKIESLDDSIKIYLNNLLKIQVPKISGNKTQAISKVGLTTNYNDVEFKPLRLGTVTEYHEETDQENKYYNYYFPLSLLALSKSSYDIFSNIDRSVYTRPVIVISDSIKYDNVNLKEYLDYVRQGGRLIVINSQNNFSTIFSQLFALNSTGEKEETFTTIADANNLKVLLNVSGMVKGVDMASIPGVHLVASYRNDKNETIAPFIIEKDFSTGGKVIFLNSRGYFDSISNSPIEYFLTLSNISKLLPVDLGQGPISQNTSIPAKGFIGTMQISGRVTLNSSSLSLFLPYEYSDRYLLKVQQIAIFKNDTDIPVVLNNVSVKDLKITGDYEATIDSIGSLELPDINSNRDYIGVQIPSGFNMTVRLAPKELSSMEIVTQNQTSKMSIKVASDSKINFNNIELVSPWKSLPVLLRSPEIKVDGHVTIKDAYLNGFLNIRSALGTGDPLDLRGQLETKLDLVDNFDQPYRNTTSTKYVTYLQMLAMDGTSQEDKDQPRLPGDIYYKAKQRGEDLHLKKILTSPSNIIMVISLTAATIIVSNVIWRRKYL